MMTATVASQRKPSSAAAWNSTNFVTKPASSGIPLNENMPVVMTSARNGCVSARPRKSSMRSEPVRL